jgi:3-dehydroquinate dehydratase-2
MEQKAKRFGKFNVVDIIAVLLILAVIAFAGYKFVSGRNAAAEAGAECELYQSNHEGCIVDKIQDALGKFDGIVINPAAYTHTSVAIADALSAVAIPTVEVHISNVMERESFRHHSFVAPIAKKTYMGLGFEGYRRAIRYLVYGEE